MGQNKKEIHLIMLSVAVEASSAESEDGRSELELIQNKLIAAVRDAIELPSPLGWQASWTLQLDPSSVNCGQCAVCSQWVTDREQPEPIPGLNIGARVDGQLLCDIDLPPGHPYAF